MIAVGQYACAPTNTLLSGCPNTHLIRAVRKRKWVYFCNLSTFFFCPVSRRCQLCLEFSIPGCFAHPRHQAAAGRAPRSYKWSAPGSCVTWHQGDRGMRGTAGWVQLCRVMERRMPDPSDESLCFSQGWPKYTHPLKTRIEAYEEPPFEIISSSWEILKKLFIFYFFNLINSIRFVMSDWQICALVSISFSAPGHNNLVNSQVCPKVSNETINKSGLLLCTPPKA